ncbi:MAG: tetratricopeptide repeat protein [Polyangiaceae bacterium]|nr:tetratricopeptide repeat protein [Polyangiaceae bacterium]
MSKGEGDEWLLINFDELVAKRQGLPPQIPVPKGKFEGLAEKGLPAKEARTWCSDFLNNSEIGKNSAWRKKNRDLVVAMEAFVDTGPLWDKAQKAFAENNFEQAISTLKRITVQHDGDHSAKLNLASAYANTGQYEPALKLFKQIYATYKGDAEFHVAVGHVHLKMQNKDGATDEFVNALEAKPDHQGALDSLTQLGVLCKIYENPKDAASLIYVRADSVESYLTGEWDKVTDATAAFYLEQIAYHERERRYGVVIEAANRAVAASGATPEQLERAELAKINALRSLERIDEALAAAKAYVERAPSSAGAHVELARTYGQMGNTAEAEAEVEKALALDAGDLSALMLKFWPDDPNDIQGIGAMLPDLEKFANEHADVPGTWRTLARAYLAVNRIDESLDLFKKAVELRPADDDLRSEWWAELAKQQRYAEILKDAEKIEDMKSRDWRLRWNEAEAYSGLGKQMEARTCYSAINFDDTLHVDIRRRAKRAANGLDEKIREAGGPAPK